MTADPAAMLPPLAAIALAYAQGAPPRHKQTAAMVAALSLGGAAASLAWRFIASDPGFILVFQYGGGDLPWGLRLAGLWASDQGTLLLTALLLSLAATRNSPQDGQGAAPLALVFAAASIVWSPFTLTEAAALAGPSPRASAHLATPWMLVHPPLILAAQVLLLIPFAASCRALRTRPPGFTALGVLRPAWLLLGLSLAAGMWWAYQDVRFGQFWHWDPVQTAIFAAWMLTTAALHARTPGAAAALTAACAIAAMVSMAVTRTPLLASSHRYVGDTSAPLLWLTAAAMALMVALSWRRRPWTRPATSLGLGTLILTLCAGAALCHLGWVLGAALLDSPRPEAQKPFLEMLLRWAGPGEMPGLRRVFALWEPDPVRLDSWLLPLTVLLALTGGHALLPLERGWRRKSTALAALACIGVGLADPATPLYQGTGMTAQGTVEMLPTLAALWTALLYMAAASLARIIVRRDRMRLTGAVHLGLAVALAAFLAATVFDSHTQQILRWPEDFGPPLRLPDGHRLTVTLGPETDDGGFDSTADIVWRQERDGRVVDQASGTRHFRDGANPLRDTKGSQRLICEILDYRYARHVATPRRLLAPLIHRGLWRDTQIWLPPIEYGMAEDGRPVRLASSVPVIIKTFPLASWMWGGIGLTLLAALALAVRKEAAP
ncbi:putative Cytochrome c-type biogenesis protein CcmF [Candidatus Terasakiella magnetica]|nr:putative Cytochrome c-type biogenesis protein CcmF [Candidatus Terasakiella magnetica]